MKLKNLIVLALAVVVAGGMGLWLKDRREKSWNDSSQMLGQKVLKSFPLNDVAGIAIKDPSGELNLVKTNDLWTVQERASYPANFELVGEFLRKVWELKVARPVQAGPNQLVSLELKPKEADAKVGTVVEFKDKDGKRVSTLRLGKKHMKESAGQSQFGGGSWPDGRYIMVGEDAATVALVSEPFANIEPKADDWLSKDFIKVETIRSVAVTTGQATNDWKVFREKEGGELKLADAKPDETLDAGKSSSIGSALTSPTFEDVKPGDAFGKEPETRAILDTFEGFTYNAQLAKNDDKSYLLRMTVDGKFEKDRTPGKDEKPEDKEKLDKEFKEKLAKLEKKLAAEKFFEKSTYVVSKWTIDPLLKVRKDLLADKKDPAAATDGNKPNSAKPAIDDEPTLGDELVPKLK